MNNIENLIEEFCDYEGHLYYPHYSGRGMYGRTCVGIVTFQSPIKIVTALFRHLIDEGMDADVIEDLLSDAKSDNMGKDIIVYFPSIECE